MRLIVTSLAAVALLASAAAPADARGRRHHRHHDDVDAGDVVAGAVVIGGVAALFSAIGEAKRARQDAAVERCSVEAENRTGGRVSEILHVGKRKGYFTVEGALDSGDGAGSSFTCTVRRGTIYDFQAGGEEA
jgi:hypothetical protein